MIPKQIGRMYGYFLTAERPLDCNGQYAEGGVAELSPVFFFGSKFSSTSSGVDNDLDFIGVNWFH